MDRPILSALSLAGVRALQPTVCGLAWAARALALTLMFCHGAGPLRAASDAAPSPSLTPEDTVFFEKKIRPLLARHCYECHSTQAESPKGGLFLDSVPGWQAGGQSGEVIVAGDPSSSRLLQAVRYTDPDLAMPPKYRLEQEEIAALEEWIARGAPDPRTREPGTEPPATGPATGTDRQAGRRHWAFQPLDPKAARGTLDTLVEAALKKEGLTANPSADRLTLMRRASFDLAGLPPKPEEIDDFLSDPRPDEEAFAAVIDKLLASESFGERWGRHWLDIVRYAETMGRTRNYPFPYAWRYRDYVIDALNADLPYAVFLRQQIAGDLLPAATPAERDRLQVATGFLALGSMDLNERNREQYLMDVVDEQIDVTGRAILALTTSCARCHDHKFDPISQADYYALAGIFRSTETLSGYQNRQGGNGAGFTPDHLARLTSVTPEVVAKEKQTVDPALQKRLSNLQRQLAQVNRQLRDRTDEKSGNRPRAAVPKRPTQIASGQGAGTPTLGDLRQRRATLQRAIAKTQRALNNGAAKKKDDPPKIARTADFAMAVRDRPQPRDCRIHVQGEVHTLGESVPRGFLSVLEPLPSSDRAPVPSLTNPEGSGRLELAEWISSPDNPLTARVMVNRLWHHLFGQGLVRTVDNFGAMGDPPSHPQLLDHLALRFLAGDTSIKRMLREIMLSETYRRSSDHQEASHAIDPENHLLWRANVRRLQAEPLRDALLSISDQLQRGRPDGSPIMYQTFRDWRRPLAPKASDWEARRSLYLPVLRGLLPEFLQVFDFAEPSQVIGRRDVTTVSTQALFFMNSPLVMDQARHAARDLLRRQEGSRRGIRPQEATRARLTRAYRLCLGRAPLRHEIQASSDFLRSLSDSAPVERWAALFQALFASAEFRYLR